MTNLFYAVQTMTQLHSLCLMEGGNYWIPSLQTWEKYKKSRWKRPKRKRMGESCLVILSTSKLLKVNVVTYLKRTSQWWCMKMTIFNSFNWTLPCLNYFNSLGWLAMTMTFYLFTYNCLLMLLIIIIRRFIASGR